MPYVAQVAVSQREYLNVWGDDYSTIDGTGVRDYIHVCDLADGHIIPYKIGPRRAGDIAQCWADTTLAQQLLNWKSSRGLEQMCADAWRWQQGSVALGYLHSDNG